jgi:hypothetical protein
MIAKVRRELIDDLMEAYVAWREECAALVQAYAWWGSGEVADREMAFAAYRAALDREQQASTVYSDRVATLQREIPQQAPAESTL